MQFLFVCVHNFWFCLQKLREIYLGFHKKKLNSGFPIGVENMGGGSSKFDRGGELKSIYEGSMGGLKFCRKIPVKEFIW